MNDNSPFKTTFKTPHENLSLDNPRHLSQISLFYPIAKMTEILKLIITGDINQRQIIVFSYLLQIFETIIYHTELKKLVTLK